MMMVGPIVYMTRTENFSAAHRLHNPRLSANENQKLFGKCNSPNGHGHNYKLEVTIRQTIDKNTGLCYNLDYLKAAINDNVMALLDHQHIDLDVSYFRDQGIVSTTENLAVFIWNQLQSKLGNGILYKVILHETDKNKFVYKGELC